MQNKPVSAFALTWVFCRNDEVEAPRRDESITYHRATSRSQPITSLSDPSVVRNPNHHLCTVDQKSEGVENLVSLSAESLSEGLSV
jgi:hypothetical protein